MATGPFLAEQRWSLSSSFIPAAPPARPCRSADRGTPHASAVASAVHSTNRICATSSGLTHCISPHLVGRHAAAPAGRLRVRQIDEGTLVGMVRLQRLEDLSTQMKALTLPANRRPLSS